MTEVTEAKLQIWANCRKLTQQQRELILEYAKTEQLENGTVNGLEQGLVYGKWSSRDRAGAVFAMLV